MKDEEGEEKRGEGRKETGGRESGNEGKKIQIITFQNLDLVPGSDFPINNRILAKGPPVSERGEG